ncbi:MAG: diguanylate cyclase (GGDEF)-like protein [Candidatus Krumholzibacteriia bacterium]|jgi:diguanylate cyclase (GGDEF)-like protein
MPDSWYKGLTLSEYLALRKLLAGDLPLDRVGPQLRQSARRALRSGDSQRLMNVAKSVAQELLRRGDLIRVDLQADANERNENLCLLKGTSRVVDLGLLKLFPLTPNAALPTMLGTEKSHPALPKKKSNIGELASVLGAMEEAQDLEIGDPQSGDKSVVLSGILRLLRKFTPQVSLHILLNEDDVIYENSAEIIQVTKEERHSGWLEMRSPGHSVWLPQAEEFPQSLRKYRNDVGAQVGVAVPLWGPHSSTVVNEEKSEAGLLFVTGGEGQWSRDMLLRMAERLGRFVTRRWQHQQDVNQRIHTDSLTKVFNRAYFDTQFTLEIERARRTDVPLTLIIADLDHFKRINDQLGHQLGDQALQMVARRLQEELRRIDHICRIGGEEFALILPGTGQEAGQEVAGRLLDATFSEMAEHNDEPVELRVTFSYGAVTFPAAGIDPFELYRKADAMLYLSKDSGRNQCHFWNSQGDPVQIHPSE